jgi:transposase-like protein
MMGERGVAIDHSTLNHWVLKYTGSGEVAPGAQASSARQLANGNTCIARSTRAATITSYNAGHDTDVEIRQLKYLNNIVEQNHRAIERLVGAMLEFKAFWSAAITIAGIEIMHMIRKSQLQSTDKLCPARQFYSLAG